MVRVGHAVRRAPHRLQTLAVMPHSACAHSMSHLPERAMSSI